LTIFNRHHDLKIKGNSPSSSISFIGWRGFILGKELLQGSDGSRFSSVIFIPVHMEDFLARNGKHATDDAFLHSVEWNQT
jgi:hypothetical protein